MDLRTAPEPPVVWQGLLGYLNFSDGKADPRFQGQFHAACLHAKAEGMPVTELLRRELDACARSGQAAFRDTTQAVEVIKALESFPAEYRKHHADLLNELPDDLLTAPFFLVRACEAILAARQLGSQDLIATVLQNLNDFVGYRPIPMLETRREGEIYSHERFRPVPLYLRDVGVAAGTYQKIVLRSLELLQSTDPEILDDAQFDPDVLDELALDVRPYDHNHPANRRPNHIFGEWDPFVIDNQGRYRRFIIRKNTVDALVRRVSERGGPTDTNLDEAGGVLAGTILMAAALCGRGPNAYGSAATLSTLVPTIARLRDRYYDALLNRTSGSSGEQLRRESKAARQPFGAARQALNQLMAQQRALQLQEQTLAATFAELGYPDLSQQRARSIDTASIRIDAEIRSHITTASILTNQGKPEQAASELRAAVNGLHRGIECGALADPWSVLGFQGLYPLFQSREDSIHDPRVEELLELVASILEGYAGTLSEAAALGQSALRSELTREVHEFANWWDRFATYEVNDLPRVRGEEAAVAAEHVATALSRLRQADGSTPDLAFWRRHLEGFRTPAAFARVVSALLQRHDLVAAQGLLMAWLGQSSDVALEAGEDSFHQLVRNCISDVIRLSESPDREQRLQRFFQSLEANAEDLWSVEDVDQLSDNPSNSTGEKELYGAAYEGMTFQDSANDGTEGALAGDGPEFDGFALEGIQESLHQKLRFQATLANLWRMAAPSFRGNPALLRQWLDEVAEREKLLDRLMDRLSSVSVPEPPPGFEGAIEYDHRRSTKEHLIEEAIAASIAFREARRTLTSLVNREENASEWEGLAVAVERSIEAGNPSEARTPLKQLLNRLRKLPLLYVPLSAGGDPKQIRETRAAQSLLAFLLERLPKLGLLRETFLVVQTARRMEQSSPPEGKKVTEFDRLFPVGLKSSIEAIMDLYDRTGQPHGTEMQETLRRLIAPYLTAWVEHSSTLRLSIMENAGSDAEWNRLVKFVKEYGRHLFTPGFLHLANIRAVLHRGVDAWLDESAKMDNPPEALLDAIDRKLSRSQAVQHLEFVLTAIAENYEEYRDYNTTTTQSDYGENLCVLLDFLRVNAAYERDAWRLRPVFLVHEVLCQRGHTADAAEWQKGIVKETQSLADRHLAALSAVEERHGVRLRTVRDRLSERFVSSLAADRLSALVQPAWEAACRGEPSSNEPARKLLAEIETFASTPSGVGLDLPPWLKRLKQEVHRVRREGPSKSSGPGQLTLEDLNRQLLQPWDRTGDPPELT